MPVYPGTEPPVFTTACSFDKTGFLEKKITFYSHTGTHVDAPAHIIPGSKTLNQFPVDHFYGDAFLLHMDHQKKQSIGVDHLERYQDRIQQVDFLLIHTGASKYWGTENYFSHYPVLSLEAATWLSAYALKGVGLDTISADKADTKGFSVHTVLLHSNTIIIENITNLEKIPCDQFVFACFPLSVVDADGSPVRAVAIIP